MGALTAIVLIAFPRGVAGFIGTAYARLSGAARRRAPLGRRTGRHRAAALHRAARGRASRCCEVTGVSRSFGNLKAVNDVSFTVPTGSITALIGPNGAGKTTLFNLIGGYQPVDGGSVTLPRPRRSSALLPNEIAALGVGRTFQNLQLFDNMTVLDNVMSGRHRFHACRHPAGVGARAARAPRRGGGAPHRARMPCASSACATPRACCRPSCRSATSAWSRSRARSRCSRRCC